MPEGHVEKDREQGPEFGLLGKLASHPRRLQGAARLVNELRGFHDAPDEVQRRKRPGEVLDPSYTSYAEQLA